jgi:hypothetical protein
MFKGLFNWHTLPRYKYREYEYVPDVEEYDDNRKIWHVVYYKGQELPFKEQPKWSPYEWPEKDEFEHWVDENYPE